MERELVFLPLPIIGHLISTVELAKRLVETHSFSIKILLMHLQIPGMNSTTISSYIQFVTVSTPTIRFVDLPLVDFPIKENQSGETFISLFIEMHKPHVKEAILKTRPPNCVVALTVDLFATTMIDVGTELGIPTYVHFASGVAFLGLMLYLPTLHEKIPCEFRDLEGEVEVPGMYPLPPLMMPAPLMNKKDEAYAWLVYHGRRFREASGLIVNSFAELEATQLKAITNGLCLPDHHTTPPIYPMGPLLGLDEKPNQPQTTQLVEWLDQQPHFSVVFLCFGSMGTFSAPQVKEIALGLERSGNRFLWSLRCRSSEPFSLPIDADLNEVLPDGFLDRTQGRGLVWPSWVPQVAILSHAAVGGFISHCGWNSSLESLWFGVPILAWPLYAEQRINAFQLVRDYGLAVELRVDYRGDGLVSAEELERGVKCLMGDSQVGLQVRKKVKEIAEVSRKAVEEGGSSFSTLGLLAKRFMDVPAVGH